MSTIGAEPVVSYFKFGSNESPLLYVSALLPVRPVDPLDPAPMNDVPVAEIRQSGPELKTGYELTRNMPAGAGLEDPESHVANA